MLTKVLKKVSLFYLLFNIDYDLCLICKAKGCPHCSGPLYFANYERKTRGVPESIPDRYLIRHSLCCGREGCRKRILPPSCRFSGRHVYWSCIILVVMALRQNGPKRMSTRQLQKKFGIDRKTIDRWIHYFRDVFPLSEKWQRIRGRVSSAVSNDKLPGQLLNLFIKQNGSVENGLIQCLCFLASG